MRRLLFFVLLGICLFSHSIFAQNNDQKPFLVKVFKPDFLPYSDVYLCKGETIGAIEKSVSVPLFCRVAELLVGTGYMVEYAQPVAEFDLTQEQEKNDVLRSELARLNLLEKSLAERKAGKTTPQKEHFTPLRGSKRMRIDLDVISDRVKELEKIVEEHSRQLREFSVTAPLTGEIFLAPGISDGAECEQGSLFARVKSKHKKIIEVELEPLILARVLCAVIPPRLEIFDSKPPKLKALTSVVFNDFVDVVGSKEGKIVCRIQVEDIDDKLDLGEVFDAKIVFCAERLAAKIPMESLFYEGNGTFGVFVVGKDYKIESRSVVLDYVVDRDTVLVSSGIKAGDWIVDRRSGILLENGDEVDPVFGDFEKIKQVPARSWGATQAGIWTDLKVFVPEALMIPGVKKKNFAAVFADTSDKVYWEHLKVLSENQAFVLVGADHAFEMPPWSEKGRNVRAALSVAVRAYGVNPDRVFVFGGDQLGALFFSGWYDSLVDGVIVVMPDGLKNMPDWAYWLFRPSQEALFLVPTGAEKNNPMQDFLKKRGWDVSILEADFIDEAGLVGAVSSALKTFILGKTPTGKVNGEGDE